jgi:hypothetical protein
MKAKHRLGGAGVVHPLFTLSALKLFSLSALKLLLYEALSY